MVGISSSLLNTSLEAGSSPMTVVLNWPALLKK
jgi:hypothetical protein